MINSFEFYYAFKNFSEYEYLFLISLGLLIFDHLRSILQSLILRCYSNKDISSNKLNHPLNNPKISILIPAYNANKVGQTIQSALDSHYKNKEIIVITNGEKDQRTYKKALPFEKRYPLLVRVFDLTDKGKALALNYGFAKSTGHYIMTLDADSKIINSLSINNFVKRFEANSNIAAMSGDVQVYPGDNCKNNLWTKLQTLEYLQIMHIGKRFQTIFDCMLIIPGGFGIFKRAYLKVDNPFSEESLSEDFVISLDVHAYGKKVVFEPNAVARFECPENYSQFVAQRTRWSYGQVETLKTFRNLSFFPKNKISLQLAIIDMWFFSVFFNMLWVVFTLVIIPVIFLYSTYDLVSGQNSLETNVIIVLGNILSNPIRWFNINNPTVWILALILLYPVTEFFSVMTAIKISGRNECSKLIWLIPFYVFIYRPFHRIIVFRAHVMSFLKIKPTWHGKSRGNKSRRKELVIEK